MSTQEFHVRYKLATKTAAEWSAKESTIKPLQGEICFYSDLKKAKLGDGSTLLKDLEFLWLNEEEVNTLIEALESSTEEALNDIRDILNTKVPNTRKINGYELKQDVTLSASDVKAIPESDKGKAGGVATLDEYGYVPSSQLPSYVDDMIEGYYINSKFYEDSEGVTEITPESGKIYVDISTTDYRAYRWAGETAGYVEVFKSVTLGETSATAYAGDKGKAVTDTVNDILDGNRADDIVTYTNEMATVNALGGIAAGTTFSDMPISELLTKLLYPYIKPTITAKTSPANGGTFENGTGVAISSIIATVTKKSENIVKVEVFDGSTSLGVKTDGSTGTLTFPVDITITSGKYFTAKVTDASGTTVSANTGTFTFVDPFYYGILDDGATFTKENMTKLVQSKGTKELLFTANNQKMVFAYPKSYGILSKIIDPNSFDVTSTWTYEEVTVEAADGLSEVAYYLYTSKLVTVDAYKMKFQF